MVVEAVVRDIAGASSHRLRAIEERDMGEIERPKVPPGLMRYRVRSGTTLIAWLKCCVVYSRGRRQLRALSDEELKDIGVSRAIAERECRRWPWEGCVHHS